jgi:hypothetical protein
VDEGIEAVGISEEDDHKQPGKRGDAQMSVDCTEGGVPWSRREVGSHGVWRWGPMGCGGWRPME